MKIVPVDKDAGLETPDGGFRARAGKDGAIEWPDTDPRYVRYAETAERTGAFRIHGRHWGGFGPGRLPKPYRVDADASKE